MSSDAKQLKPYQWKPGQSGNPGGRPKGKSLKRWTQEQLARMTDEERVKFLRHIDPNLTWRMAEGNPHQTSDGKIEVTLPKPILENVSSDHSNTEDNVPQEED